MYLMSSRNPTLLLIRPRKHFLMCASSPFPETPPLRPISAASSGNTLFRPFCISCKVVGSFDIQCAVDGTYSRNHTLCLLIASSKLVNSLQFRSLGGVPRVRVRSEFPKKKKGQLGNRKRSLVNATRSQASSIGKLLLFDVLDSPYCQLALSNRKARH